jgi:hypothetical protein
MAKRIKAGVVLAAILFALGLALFPPAALAPAIATAAGFTLIILALWATGLTGRCCRHFWAAGRIMTIERRRRS